jgi:rhamnosyltransferase
VRIAPEDYAPGKVLNEAITRTDHDLIVLLNADAVPLADTCLETLLQPLLEKQADAVFARQVARPDARFVVAYDYERAYAAESMAPTFFSAVACAFRRDVWEAHRFRNQGYAEDLAWAKACLADGVRIRFVPDAVVEHSHNYTLKALYRKRFRQAATYNEAPDAARQTYRCLREIVRDLLHACRALQLHTIPYNVAYRIAIHSGNFRGLASANKAGR